MSNNKFTRREILKISGVALGSMAVWPNMTEAGWSETAPPPGLSQQNSYFKSLKPFRPGEPLAKGEMRISFMGTSPVLRRAQAGASVFVELGNGKLANGADNDCFVFDCGTGSSINYDAMGVQMSKMRKVFLTHLHGDHMNDLTQIYCFGAQQDGKSPLYIWGPSRSLVCEPGTDVQHEDGILDFAYHFREMNRWHTESQSFWGTRWKDAEGDGYDIFATELNWKTGGGGAHPKTWMTNDSMNTNNKANPSSDPWVAYYDSVRDVKISFFPAVHDRNGSISYKLEWNGLSMIYGGDTKPSQFMIDNASDVDVLIHEIVVPPEVWSARQGGSADPSSAGVMVAETIEENSHTPEKAFGYILSQLKKPPRLAVGTHFQSEDDTISVALDNIYSWYSGPVTIVTDLVVLNVSKSQIRERRAVVSDFTWNPPVADPRAEGGTVLPKYYDINPLNPYKPYAPLSQFDKALLDSVIDPCKYDPSAWNCAVKYPEYAYNENPLSYVCK
ncbi:MBL fold metallo-hydrolase [Methylobacter tundripaludum]|uniref:MBL fold metallo-hydrolase n=1 Tax=Methylobacter tundripaludum TaxID=173365 RepID=UPI00068BCE33|nr:MBL fold metallo-hydrolase [Methylobacter tundripaludum]